jgi:FemAB-related protein (PEP-CTERM system-associated)
MVTRLSPTLPAAPAAAPPVSVRVLRGAALSERLPQLTAFVERAERVPASRLPAWLPILQQGLRHVPFAIEATDAAGRTCGYLPLAFVNSLLFGRNLASLPYLNTAGVVADDATVRTRLVDAAVKLADDLRVLRLELRHERAVEHPALSSRLTSKVHMRLALPPFPGPLWEGLSSKVRNQVRNGEKKGLTVEWGGAELLPAFYSIFSENMRDLGTPVYGRELFGAVLSLISGKAELCVVRADQQPVATSLLLHGRGVSEVPSASSLRRFNHTCANMLMYWHLLERAVQRGQAVFDFGRSTTDSSTWKFKKQWGARPEPAVWQYYLRTGQATELRPDNPKYQRLIRIWQKLPVRLTRWIGPSIVRGIP